MLVSGMLKACSISFRPTVWKYVEARDGIDFNEVDLWEIAAVTLPACPGAILLGPAKSLQQRAIELRKLAADDLRYVAKAKASEEAAAYIASTTFEQRMRERRAQLHRIRAGELS